MPEHSAKSLVLEPLAIRNLGRLHAFFKKMLSPEDHRRFMKHPDARAICYPVYAFMLAQQAVGRAAYYLAYSDDVAEPVGMALLRNIGAGKAEIGVAVASSAQGRGLGGLLMEKIFDLARERHILRLTLSFVPDNEKALALYAKFGFRESGRRTVFAWGAFSRRDEILMELLLPERATPVSACCPKGAVSGALVPLVSLVRQTGYSLGEVRSSVERLLQPLGGISAFVKPGSRVILKPNLVSGAAPEKAVTTHPSVVRAVAELCIAAGARVAIGDSPGLGSGRRAARASGLLEVAEELGLEWVDFTPVDSVDGKRMFKKLSLARELMEADTVINLPKLKTHCQMLMTIAVKNMFGAVVGTEKLQWHYRAGRDKPAFGRMLYEISGAVRPGLSIVDAIVGMDGDGPTAGEPNPTGFLAAGADPSAVDAAVMDVLGLPRERLFTLAAARAAGDLAWNKVIIVGESAESLRPARWRLPESQSLDIMTRIQRIPAVAHFFRSQLTVIPQPKSGVCVCCGACAELCPAKAIKMDPGLPVVDIRRCIGCFCCHELCPHKAMGLRSGLLARLLSLLKR